MSVDIGTGSVYMFNISTKDVITISTISPGFLEGEAGVGTVVVSVDIGTGSVHVNLLFRGIVKEGETR